MNKKITEKNLSIFLYFHINVKNYFYIFFDSKSDLDECKCSTTRLKDECLSNFVSTTDLIHLKMFSAQCLPFLLGHNVSS